MTDRSGLAGNGGSRTALWKDFDRDENLDLLVVTREGALRVYRGVGDGIFRPESGLGLGARGVLSAEWTDYDRDGWVDLALEHEDGSLSFLHSLQGRAFEGFRLEPESTTSSSGSTPAGSKFSMGGIAICADRIVDQTTSACIEADSTPTLGALYPLGTEFNIDSSGNVGIGTTSPLERLHVAGTIRGDGLVLPTGASSGAVLTSDAGGTATWQASPTGGFEATYRWATWSTYGQSHGWFGSNDASLFGGVNPSNWGDSNAIASQMSSSTDVLRTLFVRAGPALGTLKNANVYASQWEAFSSTNSRHAAALFRVENTTGGDIVWNVSWYGTAYAVWSERASIALNGTDVWNSGASSYGVTDLHANAITIPAGRTSTVIFVASASPPSSASRSTFLAFTDDCLDLPAGLQFVDDLDTKPDGWDN